MILSAVNKLAQEQQDHQITSISPSGAVSEVAEIQSLEPVKLYCLCRTTDETNMIGCDKCEEWYHFNCVGIDIVNSYFLKFHRHKYLTLKRMNSHAQLARLKKHKKSNPQESYRIRKQRLQTKGKPRHNRKSLKVCLVRQIRYQLL